MAGRGKRFSEKGYKTPKPAIKIKNKTMVQLVTENIRPQVPHKMIYVCQKSHLEIKEISSFFDSLKGDIEIITLDKVTDGMASTTLKAKKIINNTNPLMTANVDQIINFNIDEYLEVGNHNNIDGMIMTMKSQSSKWSYVKVNNEGIAIETAEKKVISENATVGIYNFKKGNEYIFYTEKMVSSGLKVNGECYICPVYNYFIRDGKKIATFNIGDEYNGMHGLGTPEDLKKYLTIGKE
ncbi:MAG: glycosyl transferase family 2 [Legionellales bacterium]|jgi:NDP-sugar pyrophosphorylase family protein|nr:glycosyl transferase family 2 [Legionellales bacterium]